MNTILIVLIIIVIYLIHTTSSKKEAFYFKDAINPYKNDPRDQCNQVNTVDDCESSYLSKVCRDKCYLIQNNINNSGIIDY